MSSTSAAAPKVGFVSLGCPKALTDSEQILTQLRAEGYETAKSYDGADLVIVNTCGFIDAAVQESLDAIGEALNENGKVIVTGCLGSKKDASGDEIVRKVHPKVLAVTGPHALGEVMDAVHSWNTGTANDPVSSSAAAADSEQDIRDSSQDNNTRPVYAVYLSQESYQSQSKTI